MYVCDATCICTYVQHETVEKGTLIHKVSNSSVIIKRSKNPCALPGGIRTDDFQKNVCFVTADEACRHLCAEVQPAGVDEVEDRGGRRRKHCQVAIL
jgi:hypothetical protein